MDSIIYIYEIAKLFLGDKYKDISYQYQQEDKEGSVGIYLYEGANDRKDIGGDVVYKTVKLHVQVNCFKSHQGLLDGINYISSFVDKIENSPSPFKILTFDSVEHLGPKAIPIGRNKYGITIVKCDVNIQYIINE